MVPSESYELPTELHCVHPTVIALALTSPYPELHVRQYELELQAAHCEMPEQDAQLNGLLADEI